jgi:hypothetical protein
VAGLQGTGSLDWSVSELFVPEERTYELGIPAPRGGDLFRLGMPAFVSNEVPPLAVGLVRRALDDMTELATKTARFPGGPTVSERSVFHKELGCPTRCNGTCGTSWRPASTWPCRRSTTRRPAATASSRLPPGPGG